MTLKDVQFRKAFELATDPAALAKAHADLQILAGSDIEQQLFAALQRDNAHCAAAVIGPSGAGKSSCIVQVVSRVASLADNEHEVLFVNAGDAESVLADQAQFAHHLVDLIRSQEFRFATAVQDELRTTGADEVVDTDDVVKHTGKFEAGARVVRASYQAELQKAHQTRTFGKNAAQGRQDLASILKVIREAGARPVVVIDDTDRFVDSISRDLLKPDTVDALFQNAVGLLDDLRVDFVVAVHPRFEGTSGYNAAKDRELRVLLEVPFLRLTDDHNPIADLLSRHLRAHDIAETAGTFFSGDALVALYTVYAESGQDIREVLLTASAGVDEAVASDGSTVEARDVAEAIRKRKG